MAEPAMAFPSPAPLPRKKADASGRVVGYLIDLIPLVILAPLNLVPIVGHVAYAFIGMCYWALRDAPGASLGKLALGNVVVGLNGGEATAGARIARNIPLALPMMFGLIPFLGMVIAPTLAFVVLLAEAISIVTTGDRVGDRLAKTTVVKKSETASGA